jgi:hypothetical protein
VVAHWHTNDLLILEMKGSNVEAGIRKEEIAKKFSYAKLKRLHGKFL